MGNVLQAGDLYQLRDELDVLRALRSPYCSGPFVEALAASPWATSRRRITVALVRHPLCPRPFVWRALPLLGWHDLLSVVLDPRTPMPVRQQAQMKLIERIPTLALGEKISLARQAPVPVLLELLAEEDSRIVAALLENPKFPQNLCVRLAAGTKSPQVLGQILRHPRWGEAGPVRKAALGNVALPVALSISLLVSLSDEELRHCARSRELPSGIRELAEKALWVRSLRVPSENRYLH